MKVYSVAILGTGFGGLDILTKRTGAFDLGEYEQIRQAEPVTP